MPEAKQLTIGSDVECVDGPLGELTQVVVDPIDRAVTHLVVEPRDRNGLGRLVPLDLVADSTHVVQLSCTRDEFDKLESAEQTHFLPGTDSFGDYGPDEALLWPYFGIEYGVGNASEPVTIDTLPLGDVGIRRGEHVHATDGDIGSVQGLVIHPGNHEVTHVLLQEGHVWGRKEVAIPIGAVTGVEDGIQLDITKDQVAKLPPVDIDK